MNRSRNFGWRLGITALALSMAALSRPVIAQEPQEDETPLEQAKHVEDDKSVPTEAISPFGADFYAGPGNDNLQVGQHDNGRGGNTFVNDPCLDPAYFQPNNLQKTVQSETELAVLNVPGSMGKKIVAGFNDSYGFYDPEQGLSGYSYSIDGGNTWIDGGGVPPVGDGDQLFGDPVVVVHNASQNFWYASIYVNAQGIQSMSVNKGHFVTAPPTRTESISNTRCLNHPELYQVPDPPKVVQERIQWDPPVQTVELAGTCHPVPNVPPAPPGTHIECDALDKEWLYVSQSTGELYMTYTRFTPEGETPIEMVKSTDGGATWSLPSVIVPNLADAFNQATQIVQTSTGRLVVTWVARTFSLITGAETENRIEYATSDDDGATWSPRKVIAVVNPQSEPPGYNRGRSSILNAPYLNYGNGKLYVTYFNGKNPLPIANVRPAGDILVSRSTDDGVTWDNPVKVNDDPGTTSHVFPTLQVDKQGQVYVGWTDRRNDPVNNLLTDVWANVSKDGGVTYGPDRVQTDVATTWFVRRDAAPNFGDYNSSELLGDNQFVLTWADGRFPAQGRLDPTLPATQRKATPDMIFTIANGLGTGPTK
jgi:BNR repeat-like domain